MIVQPRQLRKLISQMILRSNGYRSIGSLSRIKNESNERSIVSVNARAEHFEEDRIMIIYRIEEVTWLTIEDQRRPVGGIME